VTERTFRLTVAYDGTAFHGWQKQPGFARSRANWRERWTVVLASAEVTVPGAGRTDAGVHARGQVASFRHDTRLPASAFPPLLNRLLPATCA
jgi:tRNA pseudouridine38-40 synthase